MYHKPTALAMAPSWLDPLLEAPPLQLKALPTCSLVVPGKDARNTVYISPLLFSTDCYKVFIAPGLFALLGRMSNISDKTCIQQ